LRIEACVNEEPSIVQVVGHTIVEELHMVHGYSGAIGIYSSLSALVEPHFIGLPGLHPFQCPDIVIAEHIRKAFDLHEFFYALERIGPSVAHVAEADEVIPVVSDSGPLDAPDQRAVCCRYIPTAKA